MKISTIIIFIFCLMTNAKAQDKIQEKLYYHSANGFSFVPPLSRPAIVYKGKLYVGKNKLSVLFNQFNDAQMNSYFKKYISNKTTADVLSFTGSVVLPIANIFISTQQGKVNWWLIASSALLNGTAGIFKIQAEKNLMLICTYFDKKMGYAQQIIPSQQSICFTFPLKKIMSYAYHY